MEKKYLGAMRNALHQFNRGKRGHYLWEMDEAVASIRGIAYVAIADDSISWEDYTKILKLRSTLAEKLFDIKWGEL